MVVADSFKGINDEYWYLEFITAAQGMTEHTVGQVVLDGTRGLTRHTFRPQPNSFHHL